MIKQLYFTFIVLFLLSGSVEAQSVQTKDVEFFEKAMQYFDNGNFKSAILYFDSCITSNAEKTDAYAYRGIAKFELKLYNEAIEDFDLALILSPGYAEVYYYRALAKLEIGAKEKACEDLYAAYDYGFKKAMRVIENVCENNEKGKKKQTK